MFIIVLSLEGGYLEVNLGFHFTFAAYRVLCWKSEHPIKTLFRYFYGCDI